ncbi:MAG: DUF3572 family protein [Emcibacteraceae bacterium]|nr:DUF3572 family protein [Emcibacteraceae bacterium]
MNHERAEIIAINALSFIAENENYLSGYLKLSGMSLDYVKESMKNEASMKNILASVIDYMLQNEKCLLDYAENYEIDPNDVVKSRINFPGAMPFQT